MKANPGGTVTGKAIIGREKEIADIWKRLEKRSVVLTAERRVGKTCVLRKMSEKPRNRWLPLFCWVESDRHPIDCVWFKNASERIETCYAGLQAEQTPTPYHRVSR